MAGPPLWRAQLARVRSLDTRHCERENYAGAKCLAQLLEGTAEDIERATGYRHTRTDAVAAIFAGAWYMARQSRNWIEFRTPMCRLELTQACYISGCGHINEAQKLARLDGYTAQCFEEIAPYLHYVITVKNAHDTIHYVESINELAEQMQQ